MEATENIELLNYLDQIAETTRAGKMKWVEANPTTYVWSESANRGRIVLQSVDVPERVLTSTGPKTRMKKKYVMQVGELLPGSGRPMKNHLTIEGDQTPAINERLSVLYGVIAGGLTKSGLDFLKSVLPP